MTHRPLAFALAALVTTAAHAAPNPKARAEAKAHFQKAQADYKLGRFEAALDGFSAAYDLVALPELLFNIGQCHKELGNYERAVFFFEGFLRDKPDAVNRPVVEELIAESRRRQETARLAAEDAARREAEARAAVEAAKAEAAATAEIARREAEARVAEAAAREAEARAALAQERPPPPPDAGVTSEWWFWALVGGAALAAGGIAAATVPGRTVLPSGSLGTLDHR